MAVGEGKYCSAACRQRAYRNGGAHSVMSKVTELVQALVEQSLEAQAHHEAIHAIHQTMTDIQFMIDMCYKELDNA